MAKCVFHHVELTHQLSFKTYFQKTDQHTRGKWLIHGAKHHKDNQLQSPDIFLPAFSGRLNSLWSLGGPCDMSQNHYNNVIIGAIASQITSLTIVYSIVYSDADQRKHQSSASLAFVGGIHRGPVNTPHKWPVTRKMLPFHDVIMCQRFCEISRHCKFQNTHIISTFVILHFVFRWGFFHWQSPWWD